MSSILISGLVNIETNIQVEAFPIDYTPIHYSFFGIQQNPAGVGLNLAFALHQLGDDVRLLSLVGQDAAGSTIRQTVEQHGLDSRYLLPELRESAQSAILYDADGRRQIYCDLKDIQDRTYPTEMFRQAVADCGWVCLCNINFSRALLPLAKELGKHIATDVQVLSDLYDPYNADFMRHADVLFLSDSNLPEAPEPFVQKLAGIYGNDIIVVGLGGEGALLYVKADQFMGRFPAVYTRPVVNTVGAGDALFAAFVHFYAQSGNPYESLKKAMLFASYKIGVSGAAQGFLTEPELEARYAKLPKGEEQHG